jgi:ABC-type hemin transport system substrate-binding protein
MIRRAAALLMTALVSGAPGACTRSEPSSPTRHPAETRIVSFSPAISRTLVDFGLQDRVVGRTPYCESLDHSIPVVGDLLNVSYETLTRLAPTHLLIQPPLSGIDPHLEALAREKGWTIGRWHLNDVDDIETMIRELPAALFAPGTAGLESATARAAELLNEIAAALTPGADPLFRGRVLLVNSVEPVMAFGAGTYLHDLLVAMGGTNAASGRGWVSLSLEDVVRLNPQAIIIVKPGMKIDLKEAAGPLRELQIDANRPDGRRLAALSHPEAFLPSSAISEVAADLRAILRAFGPERDP